MFTDREHAPIMNDLRNTCKRRIYRRIHRAMLHPSHRIHFAQSGGYGGGLFRTSVCGAKVR